MKKAGAKIIRAVDAAVNLVVGLVCVAVLLVSCYSLWDNHRIHSQARDDSLLVYRPTLAAESGEESGLLGLKDQVGWLYLDGTYIDYPVMQGKDNFTYLNKDPYGEYRMCGSIFLDSRNAADFSDPFSMVYGHHMDHYNMFGALDLFAVEVYFNNHQTGWLATNRGAFRLDLFAVAWGEGDDWVIFNPVGKTPEDVLPYIEEHAVINRGYQPGRRIVALSTCAGETESSRLIVFGMLGNELISVP